MTQATQPLTASFDGLGPEGSDLEFTFPEGGGIVEIVGENGCGKSEILHHAEVVISGNGKLNKRDKSANGTAEICGAKVTVKRLTKRTGELEVSGVGDLDIAVLHDPGKTDPVVNDAQRIKALVRLSNRKAEIEQFYDLVGGREKFDEIVDESARKKSDLVDMSGIVKRGFEKEARRWNGMADAKLSDAVALRKTIETVDITQPHGDELRTAHEAAIAARTRLLTQRDTSVESVRLIDNAQQQLSELRKAVKQDATADREAAERLNEQAEKQRQLCADQLRDAEENARRAESALETARQVEYDSNAAGLRCQTVSAELSKLEELTNPSDEVIEMANQSADDARDAYDNGKIVSRAIETEEQADKLQHSAKELQKESDRFRVAAQACSEILSGAVASIPNCTIVVHTTNEGDDRLTVKTPRDEHTMFGDLSDGERWPHIVPLAAGERRVIVLPQPAWEGLDPTNRALLHGLCRQHGCWIITARADAGAIRAMTWCPTIN